MERCNRIKCYYNHDGRCGVISYKKTEKGYTRIPSYCPKKCINEDMGVQDS